MLKDCLSRGISTPIAITIIAVLVAIVGGFTWWQYSEIWESRLDIPEIRLPDKNKEALEEIKIGKIDKDFEKIVKEIEGHQPWRANPEMVLEVEADGYGFTPDDVEKSTYISKEEAEEKYGISERGYLIPHNDNMYLVIMYSTESFCTISEIIKLY